MSRYEITGEYLKDRRGEMSQGELAKKVNCHIQFVSNWERGLCLPPEHCMKKLSRILKLDFEQFLGSVSGDLIRHLEHKYRGLK